MQEITNFNLERTTTEILMLKDQTAQNIIEIGKRLVEVKENLQHGEYLEWLKGKVQFTERTAQRFMQIGKEFSNTTSLSHLGSTKLFLLAGLDEEDRQEIMQGNNVEDMSTRELEQVVKEKKEIKKQLDLEKEYSQELQETIRQKEGQIRNLQSKIENATKPEVQTIEKEVVKEVVPEHLIQEKEALEQEVATLKKRAEKAEDTLKSIRLEDNLKQDKVFDTAKLDMLIFNVNDFLSKNSKFTYLKEDLQNIPPKKKKFVEQSVNSIKEWVMLMEQALDNRQDVIGNIIYGEGEVIYE